MGRVGSDVSKTQIDSSGFEDATRRRYALASILCWLLARRFGLDVRFWFRPTGYCRNAYEVEKEISKRKAADTEPLNGIELHVSYPRAPTIH